MEESKRAQAKRLLLKYASYIPFPHFPQSVGVDMEKLVDLLIDAAIEEIKTSLCSCEVK